MKRTFALTDLIFSYPASLDMLKGSEIFTKEPINPYTGKSMYSAQGSPGKTRRTSYTPH